MKSLKWQSWPLYAWLIALYAVLFLFGQNVGEVITHEVWLSAGLVLLLVTVIAGLAFLPLRSMAKAGAVAAIIALAFFSYGHVFNLVEGRRPEWVLALIYSIVVVASIAAIALADAATIRRAAPPLNIITLALVLMTLPPLISFSYRNRIQSARASEEETTDDPHVMDSTTHPDIYYIILDAYSGNEFLLHDYGYDNSPFTDSLEDRGFTVAYDSKTSYAITVPSLFASLNMRYITPDDENAADLDVDDVTFLRRGIADSAVARELKSHGYTYVFMLSGYDVPSSLADMNIDFHPTGTVYYTGTDASADGTYNSFTFYRLPFLPLLASTTAVHAYAEDIESVRPLIDAPYDFRAPERALVNWDEGEKIPELPEATFTVIHIIKPHEPIAFDREGNILTRWVHSKNSTPDELWTAFFEQLAFTNNRTLRMIDEIIRKSDVPPIIILQGDHGSHLGNPRSADAKRTNFGILNAYNFGGRTCAGVTNDTIPINSFRILFNCVFDADYELVEPHYYLLPVGYQNLFRFEEVDIDAWEAEHEGE
jgi:hypothetical protein